MPDAAEEKAERHEERAEAQGSYRDAWQRNGVALSVERGGDEEQAEKRSVRVCEAKEFAALRVV